MTSLVTLALDAGQSGAKVRVTRTGQAPLEHTLPGVRNNEALLPQLAAIVRSVREDAGHLDVVAIGSTGLTGPESDAALLRDLLGEEAPSRLYLAHDSVSSYLGTLGHDQGSVVAVGTGVIILAVGADAVARVDGWGNIMGDAGSAYWIGRAGMDAAMRGFDGRIAPTVLTELLSERYGALDSAYVTLQADPDRVRNVAAFAEQVADSARDGDEASLQICHAAAEELATGVVASLRRVGLGVGASVSAIGGVLRSDLIRLRFEERMRERVEGVVFEAPHGSGLDGAAALVDLADTHPLRSMVSIATH